MILALALLADKDAHMYLHMGRKLADAALGLWMDGPDHFDMPVSAVTVGATLAFAGFPGEPFTEIGRRVKERSPFAVTIVACLVNDSFGYFPSTGAYAEGGYEVLSSKFAAPVGDTLIRVQLDQLEGLAEK